MNDLRLVFVQLAKKVHGPRAGDQDQLHLAPKRAQADFLVDLPELAGEIERRSPSRVRGEEQDLDLFHPDPRTRHSAKGLRRGWMSIPF